MRIEHVAVWTEDLQRLADFYCGYFGATAGPLYVNPLKGFQSRFLSTGTQQAVDDLTQRLRQNGFDVVDGPRRTGDGYYESVVLDPDGNRVEITI